MERHKKPCSENTQKIITKHNTRSNQHKQRLQLIKLIKQKLHDYEKEGRNIGSVTGSRYADCHCYPTAEYIATATQRLSEPMLYPW
jgi:hypothetical protein